MTALVEKESISDRIRRLRVQKGMNQKKFAQALKLHPAQYNRYEMGENIPSTEILGKLADALGVTVDYLFEGQAADAVTADFEDRDLLILFKEVEKFPAEKKIIVKGFLEEMTQNQRMKQAYEKTAS